LPLVQLFPGEYDKIKEAIPPRNKWLRDTKKSLYTRSSDETAEVASRIPHLTMPDVPPEVVAQDNRVSYMLSQVQNHPLGMRQDIPQILKAASIVASASPAMRNRFLPSPSPPSGSPSPHLFHVQRSLVACTAMHCTALHCTAAHPDSFHPFSSFRMHAHKSFCLSFFRLLQSKNSGVLYPNSSSPV
jgi:hypothetical protein